MAQQGVQTESTAEATAGSARHRSFGQRFLAALRLESALYEEVEHDGGALGQATLVVALGGLASGVMAASVLGAPGLLSGIVSSFLAWLVWTAIVWGIGVKLFDHTSNFEELLRTLGFVAAPQVLYVIALVPVQVVRWIVGLVVLAMTVLAFVRAVRQALDVDTGRALFVSFLSVVAYVAILLVVGAVA